MRKTHGATLKTKVALKAVKSEKTIAESSQSLRNSSKPDQQVEETGTEGIAGFIQR